MIKMDLSTKQVFLSGLLAWILTICIGVVANVKQQENHDVRMGVAEKNIDAIIATQQQQRDDISDNRRNSAITAEALTRISESQDQMAELFRQMNERGVRTETTLEHIKERLTQK